MAEFVYTDAYVMWDSGGDNVELSSYVRSVTLTVDVDLQESTAMGDSWRERLAGLKDWSVSVELNQDFTNSGIQDSLFEDLGSSKTLMFRPDKSDGLGVNNPNFSGSAFIESLPIVDSSVGDVATVTISFQGSGALARAEE